MTDRRFNEDEVAAIFQLAAETQHPPRRAIASAEGLTLAELQEIGQQAGIAPELVVRAAASLGPPGSPNTRRFFGLPLGVGRTIELDRKLSEDEWARFVVDLRETFDARGTVRQDGSFHQWTNGNLQVLLEPTASGQRIRFRTSNGITGAWMSGGFMTLTVAAFMAVAGVIGVANHPYFTWALEIAALGAAQLAIGALRVPGWARLRRRQMEEISARLSVAMTTVPPNDSRG